jgi:hypothetical protein
MMDVNEKLSEEYKGKRYRRPTDGRVIVISHVLQADLPDGTPYLEAFYNVVEPAPETTGHGTCSLEYLKSLTEVE